MSQDELTDPSKLEYWRQRGFQESVSSLNWCLEQFRQRQTLSSCEPSVVELPRVLEGHGFPLPVRSAPSSGEATATTSGRGSSDLFGFVEVLQDEDTNDEELERGVPTEHPGAGGKETFTSGGAGTKQAALPIDGGEGGTDSYLFRSEPSLGWCLVVTHHYQAIGKGSSSVVYRGALKVVPADADDHAINAAQEVRVALKVIPIMAIERWAGLREAVLLRATLQHPGIVEAYFPYVDGFSRDEDNVKHCQQNRLHFVLAMEDAAGGSLAGISKQKEGLTESEVRDFLRKVLPAMEFLHDTAGVAHNDIKPHNILVFPEQEGYQPGEKVDLFRARYKVADLSSVQRHSTLAALREKLNSQPPQDLLKATANTLLPGTPSYMSPESCLGVTDCAASDVWSLGIVVFQLVTGRVPWSPLEGSVPTMIVNGFREKFACGCYLSSWGLLPSGEQQPLSDDTAHKDALPFQNDTYVSFGPILEELECSEHSEHLKDLIRQCLTESPFDRPTCHQLREHPFVAAEDCSSPSG